MRILLFAQLKDAAGRAEIAWPGAGPLRADQFWTRLIAEYPALAPHRPMVRLARNGAYASADTVFQAGDEIALIPPVSGG